MNVHFFSFTGIPELIVKKNYTRKQYELLVKLLTSVKNEYLEQRAKTEADNVEEQEKVKQNVMQKQNTESAVITEEDLVDMQLLDDFLTRHQINFEQKKSLWKNFIDRAKEECRDKLDSLRDNKPTKR